MKSVRIEQISTVAPHGRPLFVIDVVCDCGNNGLVDEATGEASFKHPVSVGGGQDKVLVCRCGKKYRLHPQETHIHVFSV